jgi:tetratricopeptide (TPR) repeat protein
MEGRPEKAAEHYRAALDRGEAAPDLVARFVRLLLQQRNFSEATSALARLRAAENAGELGRLATISSLMAGESNRPALEAASKKLSADSKDPLDHLLRGRLLQGAGKFDEAESAFRRAIELAPRQPEGHLALIGFLAEQFPKKTSEAVKQAEKQLASSPLALAACYELAGEREQAEAQFRAAHKASPDDPAVLRAVALASLRRGQLATAEEHFKKLIDLVRESDPVSAAWARRTLALAMAATGDFARYQKALALLEENTRNGLTAQDQRARALIKARQPKDRREAIRDLEASFANVNPTPEEEFFLAALLIADRDWTRANERLIRLLASRNGPNPAFLLFYVGQLIQHDELDKAEHWVKRLEGLEADSLRSVAARAQLLHARKNTAKALEILSADANKHARDAARQLGLARVMESLGAAEDAEKAFRRYAELRGKDAKDAAAVLPLIQFLGRRNRVGEALELCAKARGKVRDAVFAEVAVGVLRDGEPTESQVESVIRWLRQDRQKSKDTTILDLALANVSDLRGKSDEAAAQYRELLKRDGRNVLAHNNLAVLLALHQRKHEAALASIDKALEQAGPQPELLDTKGIVLLAADKPGAAAEVLEQATQMTPDPASYFRLATAQLKANRAREARETWLKAKAAGFKVKLLHPLERPGADEALKLLQAKG